MRDGAYVYQEFPKVLRHPVYGVVVVDGAGQERDVLTRWAARAEDEAQAAAPVAPPVPARRKPGRPRRQP